MKIEKALFLDIDGVLATTKQFHQSRNSKTFIKKYDIYPFDKKCVNVLNEILKATNPIIILTSDWKIHYTMVELADIFKINNVCQPPVFTTSNLYKKIKKEIPQTSLEDVRITEIKEFLSKHEVDKFVVVDDLDMEHGFKDRFVICDNVQEGIKKNNVKETILKKLL